MENTSLTNIHQVCPVGYFTARLVDTESHALVKEQNRRSFIDIYPEARRLEALTKFATDLSQIKLVYSNNKMAFLFGCTKDGVKKIVYNIYAIAVNVGKGGFHLLAMIFHPKNSKKAALLNLKLLGTHLSQILSNVSEIVRNIIRCVPFVGHILGNRYQKLVAALCDLKWIKIALWHKISFEYNTHNEEIDSPNRLKITEQGPEFSAEPEIEMAEV